MINVVVNRKDFNLLLFASFVYFSLNRNKSNIE